mgnify:CR=1 FL=1
MLPFLARRLLFAIITLFVVSLIVFAMARIAGDPRTMMLGDFTTTQQFERVGERLGLDKPYYVQYWIFLKGMVRGDFGTSTATTKEVTGLILQRLGATFQLAGVAFLFAIIVGVPLGVLSAVKRGSIFDQLGKFLAFIGQSAPSFWIGIMLIFFFSVRLGWVPPSGRGEWNSIFLPAISLGWFFMAANMRLVRSSMLDVLDSEYIKLAKAKGVGRRAVIWKHALRNAVIPPLTFAGVSLGGLVTGSISTELVFAWPGLGLLAINSTLQSDYTVLQAVVIVFTLLYLAAAFLVDVLYAFADPRIRYA